MNLTERDWFGNEIFIYTALRDNRPSGENYHPISHWILRRSPLAKYQSTSMRYRTAKDVLVKVSIVPQRRRKLPPRCLHYRRRKHRGKIIFKRASPQGKRAFINPRGSLFQTDISISRIHLYAVHTYTRPRAKSDSSPSLHSHEWL